MLGRVQVNNLNLMQGAMREVENHFLFIGAGVQNLDKLVSLNLDSDLDTALGGQSQLRTQIEAAKLNAGENWNACVMPLSEGRKWQEAALYAMEKVNVEAIVLTDPVARVEDIEDMQGTAELIMGKFMSPVFISAATRQRKNDESWEDYLDALHPLTDKIAADQCTLTVPLFGHELGTYMGRLANRSVTVADSPMRVQTGPLLGHWATRPQDVNGRELDMGILHRLDQMRYSVPQWHPGYEGTYWGDGNVLDVNGGDYQVIENLRVVQKAMRRVYPLCVSRIADRALNETPASIAQAKLFFTRPLREMAKTRKIKGRVFPGEIYPPSNDCIEIHWISKYALELYISVRPYNSPKNITCNVLLDLENYA